MDRSKVEDLMLSVMGVLDALYACGKFDNGVTDPTGAINEGDVRGWEAVSRLQISYDTLFDELARQPASE